ncbi:hypothetical protein BH20ACT6_BH20ACT6_16690 [soil metagenome]
MSDGDTPAELTAKRRRRLAALGEMLTVSSGDERAAGWSEPATDGSRDEELRGDVPPHHG